MNHKFLIASSVLFIAASCSTSKKTENPSTVSSVGTISTPKEVIKENPYKTITTSYMDKSIRPQDDFFLYCDGDWVKNNPVPSTESRWGSFNELDKANQIKLTEILDKAVSANDKKGTQNQILGDYYSSFMNMTVRNQKGISPIQADLDKIKNIKSKQEIISFISESHKYGVGMLFGFGVDQDLKNVNKNSAYIGQAGIGLPNCEYYIKKDKAEILKKYEEHIVKMFQALKYDENSAKSMAKSVIAFETSLAQSMMTPAENRIPENTYNPQSKKEIDKNFGKFDFESYLVGIGSQSFDTIIVGQPKFILKVADLMANEKMENWKNYLLWSTLNHYSGLLNDEFVKLNFNFYSGVIQGKSEMSPMNEQAIDEITGLPIGELLGKAFVDIYFSESAKNRVDKMVDNLLLVFKQRIENLDWMSKETKVQATLKLNAIGRKLGFPDKWEDFSMLNISKEDYIANVKEIALYAHKKNLADLTKPVDKAKWGMPAHMVNAYYHPLLNEIAFPAGIMQPPFFDVNAEDAVNYGTIGMVIGHEFTHGFDDMGSKFAADGSFRNWWTEEDLKLFEAKTSLLGATFSTFCTPDGQCVNPELTMGENIADLGGLTLAFNAYKLTNEYKANEIREGFTPAQRFFIAYAQLWKINYTEAELKNRLANDPHSPGMYRVNGPLKNCPEFFEAFGVKEGDKMRNSADKVSKIW
ncbi:MAG: M13 family metallopeptidase [Fluviicola sp.]|jgi:putative endopeptidase|nr:M13 family metallopeptidase [Fluviicola sp.]